MTLWANKGLNTFTLKMLAALFMLLDHIYVYFFSSSVGMPLLLRCFGRMAYPLFLFCMVWGYHYTKNRKIYLLRLYLCSLFMTGFIYAVNHYLPTSGDGYLYHNIFLSMFWVGLLISSIETFQKDGKKGGIMLGAIFALQVLYYFVAKITGWNDEITAGIIPNISLNEFGFEFIALGVLMYFFKEKKTLFCIMYVIFCIVQFSNGAAWSLLEIPIQWLMIAALPLMMLYNNKKGYGLKYFFYIFYIAHTFLLFYLANFVF